MNNRINPRISLFIIAAALLTAVMTTTSVGMIPAVYAGENDDDDHEKNEKNGDGNKQQTNKESAGILADCDTNNAESIYICSAISPVCRPGAVCVFGQVDPTLTALPISWR